MKLNDLLNKLGDPSDKAADKRLVVSLFINGQFHCLPVTGVDADNFPDCVLEAEEVEVG